MPGKTKSTSKSSSSKSKSSSSKSKSRSSRSSKSRKEESKRAETAPTTVVEERTNAIAEEEPRPETTDATQTTSTDEVKRRVRRVVDRDSILAEFDRILVDLDAEVQTLRSSDSKSRRPTGVKFLRSTSKRIKVLRNDASRVMKVRKTAPRNRNTTSGFMKPVNISKEMCGFTGWETDCPKSRVDVTKFICNYIREKDLQNPTDRRIILPDTKLKKLLNIDGTEDQPLTYYSLQKRIQHHFTTPSS